MRIPGSLRHWRRRSVGELYLLVTGLGMAAMGAALLVLPARLTTGPSLATLYGIADRSTWGALFGALGLLALAAALHPTEERFVVVMSIEVAAQTAWAIGLTMPSLEQGSVSNVLAPIAWIQLAGTLLVTVTAGRRPMRPPSGRGRRRTDRTA